MKKKPNIQFIDVTLREGSYTLDSPAQTVNLQYIVDYLDGAGVPYLEIANLGETDFTQNTELIQSAREVIKKSKIGVLANPKTNHTSELEEVSSSIDFLRIGVNIHEIPAATQWVKMSKDKGLLTFVQLMRTPSLPPFRAAVAARKAEKLGADVIYIVDTMGSLTPPLLKDYVKAFREHVGVPLGFHAHNNLSLAIANCLEAIRIGCRWIDASLLGIGRQAGNAQLEILALLLEREGFKIPFDIPLLLETAESLVAPIFKNYKGIEPYDVWAAFWNLDLYPRWVYRQLALAVGLDTKSFIKELARFKNFVTLDEDQLSQISKRFNVPFEKLLTAIESPPERIISSHS